MTPELQTIYDLSQDCARNIYGTRAPSSAYAKRVGDLLFGTYLQESNMGDARRQYKFSWSSDGGGWGGWQCEQGSIVDSLRYLKQRPDLAKRAGVWLAHGDERADARWLEDIPLPVLLRLLAVSDRLACLFARLHYLKFPAAVPEGVNSQARYWKAYYNTHLGAGVPADYYEKWDSIFG